MMARNVREDDPGLGDMQNDNRILNVIFDAVTEFNQQLPPEQRLKREPDTIVVGSESVLDSLGLVSFLVLVEDTLSSRLGLNISLLQDGYVLDAAGPLRTIASIAEHVATQMPE